ncbi:NAD(P)H-hydrate dehydratase [Lentisphaera profundi]|uniref:Bifunctional NAD(P)H-hydrate repair enzyme n=1 Tax=Lentisphaera profundi TaxID=1658616 RepID=A0ABY7VRZ6_9BACT|nr:NAD(P)H-hydrate dehydratase [Lentisphaera profundi]WDE96980.1 NAD(P)H-hydrate dehydratase [Lentisphaera profundi]
MKIVSSHTMRTIDQQTIKNGKASSLILMERAGEKCANEIDLYCASLAQHHLKRIIILCGPGNNGGDGFVIARHLRNSYSVKILCTHTQEKLSRDALIMSQSQIDICNFDYQSSLIKDLHEGDIIIDCLFGTGLNRPLSARIAELVNDINSSTVPVISIDSPSGLNSEGEALGICVKAHLTLSIGLAKTAYFENSGPVHIGALRNLNISFPHEYIDQAEEVGQAFFAEDAKKALIEIDYNAHKYLRGQCLIIAGSANYSGAAIIAADAAAVSGAGMTILSHPNSRFPQNPGVICLQHDVKLLDSHFFVKSQSVLIGPGLEITDENEIIFKQLIQSNKALVIDAAAIDLIAKNRTSFPREFPTIITPHEGELLRLSKALNYPTKDLLKAAQKIAKDFGIYIILKGPQSKVFNKDGNYSINTSGNKALSSAGSGDALAGILVSIWARPDIDYYEQAKLACFIHGLSAELYTGAKRSFPMNKFPELISKAYHFLSPHA